MNGPGIHVYLFFFTGICEIVINNTLRKKM